MTEYDNDYLVNLKRNIRLDELSEKSNDYIANNSSTQSV